MAAFRSLSFEGQIASGRIGKPDREHFQAAAQQDSA